MILRRTAGYVSPLLFIFALLLLGSSFAAAGEEPVKPEKKAGESKSATDKPADNSAGAANADTPQTGKPAAAEASAAGLGEPLAPGMIEILQQEIRNAVHNRGIDDNFARFQRYSGYKLDSSAAAYTGSELAGNCRLSWYDHMLRHPLGAVAEAEQFTRDVHTAILKDRGGLAAPAADHRREARPAQARGAKVCESQDAAGGAGRRQAGPDRGPRRPGRGARPAHQERNPRAVVEHLSRDGRAEPRGPYAQRSRHRPPPGGPDGEDGPRRDAHRGRGPGPAHRSATCSIS